MTDNLDSMQRLQPGCLIHGRIPSKPKRAALYRVLHLGYGENAIFLIEISGSSPPSTRMYERDDLKRVQDSIGARIQITSETVRLPIMALNDEELSNNAKIARDRRVFQLGDLISEERRGALYDESRFPLLVAERANATGVSKTRIRRLLTLWWWFGCDNNALLQLCPLMGGPGKPRFGGKNKKGAPNANVQIGQTRGAGVNKRRRDLPLVRAALNLFWVEGHSLQQTYDKMVRTLCLRWHTTTDGKRRQIPLDPSRIITYSQFLRLALPLTQSEGFMRKKLGDIDYEQHFATRPGNAADIAIGAGDISDGDCTDFQVQCVVTKDGKSGYIGTMKFCFWVDRGSGFITGFHASTGGETWDLYRQALFVACTPKTELLELAGLEPDDWPTHFIPNKIFVDRGPGRGKQAHAAIVGRLKIGRAVNSPRKSHFNAKVENVHGIIKEKLATMVGGHRRSARDADNSRIKKNMTGPLPTEEEVIIATVHACVEHNHYSDASAHITRAMREDKKKAVEPNPQSIYLWSIKNVVGSYGRVINPAELYTELLNSKEVAVQAEGICFQKAWFQSDQVRAFRGAKMYGGGKSPRITVYFHPLVKMLYWRPSDGDIAEIPIKRQSQAKYEGTSWQGQKDYNLRERARINNQRKNRLRHGKLTSVQQKIALNAAERSKGTTKAERKRDLSEKGRNRAISRKQQEDNQIAKHHIMMAKATGLPATPATNQDDEVQVRQPGTTPLQELFQRHFVTKNREDL